MSKYIDAEKLITEIKRRMNENYELAEETPMFSHRAMEDYGILAFIEALQQERQEQPKVDLEAEIYKLYDGEYHDTEDVARHFYELGRNARKED